jgi:hypothetical protein
VTQRQKQIIAGVNQFNGAVLRADQITRPPVVVLLCEEV